MERGLLVPLVVGVLVRVILAPISGHPWDTYVWYRTGETILQGQSFYGLPAGYAYPPLWAGFLGVATLAYAPLSSLFNAHPLTQAAAWVLLGTNRNLGTNLIADWLFILLAKIPIILFDCLLAFLLYRLVERRFHDTNAARRAFLLFFLNPLAIWISSAWGMFDAIPTYFALAGTLFFLDHRGRAAGLSFGIATALKYFPALLLFALLLGYRRDVDRPFFRDLLGPFFAVLILVSIPFLLLDGGAYVTGVLSPVSGAFVGNLTIWVAVSDLGISDIPVWITVLDLAALLLVTGIVSWSLGRMRDAQSEPTFWNDLSILALLAFYLVFRTINEQYLFWILPFLTLDIVLGRERLRDLIWVTALPLLHSLFILNGSSYFLPILTFAPRLGPFIPMTPDWPFVRDPLGVLFWVGLLFLFRSRLRRWGGFRNVEALFIADVKGWLARVLRARNPLIRAATSKLMRFKPNRRRTSP